MVNTFGLAILIRTIFFLISFVAFFYFGLNILKKKPSLSITQLYFVFFLFYWFSTWMMLPIRANANVVINEK